MTLKKEVTLKDIAEAVGKSVTAVSRALNDYDDISPETRSYIKQIAQEMGYTPNLMAQRLQKKATDTIGIILPVLSPRNANPYFSELLVGIANEATEQGFDLLVSTCPPSTKEEQAYTRLISSRRVDGMIVAQPRYNDTRMQFLQQENFPFVIVGQPEAGQPALSVADDMAEGIRLAVRHLITQGHRNIAFVNGPSDLVSSGKCLAGFQGTMLHAGIAVNEDWMQECPLSQKEGYQVGQLLLNKVNAPTAIVTTDDMVAFGVMTAIQDLGLEIGHDVSVTGYGDILLAEYSHPPLTTVQRPTYTLGQQACRMLITKVHGKTIPEEQLTFNPSLVIRQSTDISLWL